jgi:hypothetical protein
MTGTEAFPPKGTLEKWAYKIVTEPTFRETFISRNPELPNLWEGH